MKRSDLIFSRPLELQATAPAEVRGISRDQARLMVSDENGHRHAQFRDLPDFLNPGDLLVVNDSATIPASLPANGAIGEFIVNLCTDYGSGLWLVEPRWSSAQPGPLPLEPGTIITVGDLNARLVCPFPGLPRLWFVQFADAASVRTAMARFGTPIRYGYVETSYPLSAYQTVFSKVPGSAEMPSAAYPFTERLIAALRRKGIQIASLTLHTGVSSLEVEVDDVEQHPLYPEPFHIPEATANAVNAARAERRQVIAVGTTVVRALESAWDGQRVNPMRGFTRAYIHPRRGLHVADSLITGLHDPVTSHLAMLYAIAGQDVIRSAYAEAVQKGYLWHEFGDSHLILSCAICRAKNRLAAAA
ncbi:MAG TPA: S-adenosylmethionine:tRNA ribosyltransferase-isomerase [Oceanobacillus sp.]|nr:S-adenosylmethionine:tRNA ribosyltransferase-isomerase [Oceanobacillus sp.]